MLPVASYFSSAPSRSACTHVSLQCHVEAYEAVAAFPSLESQQKVAAPLRESPDGPGLSVDVTGDERWLPFTVWTLKLISHCLTEGPLLLLEGLLSFSFVETVGALLSYGHTDLRKACCDEFQSAYYGACYPPLVYWQLTCWAVASSSARFGSPASCDHTCGYPHVPEREIDFVPPVRGIPEC